MRNAARITGAAIVAAVLVSGCGSSKNDGKQSDATPSATASQAAPSASAPVVRLDGTWAGDNADGVKSLTVVGDKAAIAGKTVCAGATVVVGGQTLLHLKCADHSTDHANGVVTPGSDGKTLSVNWGSSTDTFSRTATKPIIPSIDKLKQ
ncbi:hypothetical protein [Streptomyces silvisoli]|uniref:Lipoprotein n=1 Tax=Streptomyces silvisoli TaxID=3034235 RepID=A0ABT5ZTP8_9ACTN|nr:hypothetical protein [Streptomyces silvisoli]MDF3293191.1 hypothetical protein [Streptomyces silvisoli]